MRYLIFFMNFEFIIENLWVLSLPYNSLHSSLPKYLRELFKIQPPLFTRTSPNQTPSYMSCNFYTPQALQRVHFPNRNSILDRTSSELSKFSVLHRWRRSSVTCLRLRYPSLQKLSTPLQIEVPPLRRVPPLSIQSPSLWAFSSKWKLAWAGIHVPTKTLKFIHTHMHTNLYT